MSAPGSRRRCDTEHNDSESWDMLAPIPRSEKQAMGQLRLYFFVVYGGWGFLLPFLNLFYRRQGLTGTEIGLLGTIAALMGLVVAPFWGRWSDRSASPQRLLQGALLGTAVAVSLLSQQHAFGGMAVIVAVNAMIVSGIEPLSNVMALDFQQPRKGSGFGSVRLAGSLGWAVLAYASGWLVEQTGLFSAFVGYVVGMLVSLVVLGFPQLSRAVDATSKSRAGGRQVMAELARDRVMVALAVALLVGWISRNGIYQFEAIYLDELGARESIIGLATTVGALMEIPGMLWADRFLKRFGAISVLRASYGLRALLMGAVLLMPGIPTILVARAIGGVSYSFFIVSLVDFIREQAPFGQRATVLALYTVTLRNIITMASAPLGGMFYDAWGAYWLYALALVGGILSWGILGAVGRYTVRERV